MIFPVDGIISAKPAAAAEKARRRVALASDDNDNRAENAARIRLFTLWRARNPRDCHLCGAAAKSFVERSSAMVRSASAERITMPLILSKNRAGALAAAMLMATLATPAMAEGVVGFRVPFAPVIVPPFWAPPAVDGEGNGLAPDRLSVAVGAAVASDYEGSDKYILAPVAGAMGRWHGHLISWEGKSLAVDLVPQYQNQKFKFIFAPLVSLNLDRTGTARDPVVALLPKRKLAVDGGASIGFMGSGVWLSPDDTLTVQVTGTHDLGSADRSFVITPAVSYSVPYSKAVLFSVVASVDVAGAGYARYYFGIDSAGSAASGLPQYSPGGGLKSASLGLGGVVSLRGDLRKGFAVGALLNYARLLGNFADSPIVAMRGSPDQFSATVGLGYTF